MAYPVRAILETERNKALGLTEQEAERLKKGEVIQKAVDVDGEKTRQYLQLDPETRSVIHRRVTEIRLEQKLKDMEKVNDIELGTQQKQQVRDGKPVELNVGGEKVSVGVDLREPQGFKIIKGDLKEWERQQKLRYDELHPEYLGLVADRQQPLGIPEGRGLAVAGTRHEAALSQGECQPKSQTLNPSAYGKETRTGKCRRHVAAVRFAKTEASRRNAPLPQGGLLRDVPGGCGQGRHHPWPSR